MPESEDTMPSIEQDQWIRFDLWAARSWEAASAAMAFAIEGGPSTSAEYGVDRRVLALFHAAELAKEFSFAVNPNNDLQMSNDNMDGQVLTPEMIVELLTDDDE